MSRKPTTSTAPARGRSQMSGVSQLAPVASANLHDQVLEQLRQAIMAGKFRPGETLTLRGLAAALGTSIMPARDAVLRLIAEHALERDGRRVRIPLPDRDRLLDIWRFRIALEGEAASLAAERATAAEISAIEQIAARVEKARQGGRVDRFAAANQEFHFTVYRAAHNDLLQSMIETLWLQIGPHLGNLVEMSVADMAQVRLEAHDRLVAAIRQRDPVEARAALRADLEDSVDILEPLENDPPSRKRA
jgi:DNA-binding GntR family transcriptional regulator